MVATCTFSEAHPMMALHHGGVRSMRCEHFADAMLRVQPLDNRTLSRLETAVSKSSYVGQGKKLKVTNEVGSKNGHIPRESTIY